MFGLGALLTTAASGSALLHCCIANVGKDEQPAAYCVRTMKVCLALFLFYMRSVGVFERVMQRSCARRCPLCVHLYYARKPGCVIECPAVAKRRSGCLQHAAYHRLIGVLIGSASCQCLPLLRSLRTPFLIEYLCSLSVLLCGVPLRTALLIKRLA